MDPLWIVAAFVFGAVSARIGLPPLVGYLVAGFVLNSLGVEGGRTLEDHPWATLDSALQAIWPPRRCRISVF